MELLSRGAIFTPTVSKTIWTTNKHFVPSINVLKTPTGKYKIRKINRQRFTVHLFLLEMRNSPLFSILGILVLLASSARTVFFQKVEFDGKNACIFSFPNFAVKIWQQADNLTSSPFTREMKECGFYCLQDPNCAAFQIIRTYSGKGFCYICKEILMVNFLDENVCRGFVNRGIYHFYLFKSIYNHILK